MPDVLRNWPVRCLQSALQRIHTPYLRTLQELRARQRDLLQLRRASSQGIREGAHAHMHADRPGLTQRSQSQSTGSLLRFDQWAASASAAAAAAPFFFLFFCGWLQVARGRRGASGHGGS